MPIKRITKTYSGRANPKWRKRPNVAQKVRRAFTRLAETKHVNYTQSATMDLNGSVGLLFNVNQGTGENQRTGNSLRLQSIELRTQLAMAGANGQSTDRVIYFVDKRQDYNTAPTVTMVLENADVLSGYAIGYTKRFKILFDRTYVNQANFSGSGSRKVFVRKLNMKLLEQIYDDAGTNLVKNGIYRLVISSAAVINPTTLTGKTLVKYKDM